MLRRSPLAAERPWTSLDDAIEWVAYRGQPVLWPPRKGAPDETNDTKRLALEHLKRCKTAAGKLLRAFQDGILEPQWRSDADPLAEWKPAPPDFWRDIRSLAEATLAWGPVPQTRSPRITADPPLVRRLFRVDTVALHALWPRTPPKPLSHVDRIVIAYGKSHPGMGADAVRKAIFDRRPELRGQISRLRIRELVRDRKAGRPTKSRRRLQRDF